MAQGIVRPLVNRLVAALESSFGDFEIVLVDDGSTDLSWQEILDAASDDRIVPIKLSRNFGQHVAISAGLDFCSGDIVVVMDCDLQDRPEEVPRLIEALQKREDCECVIALRRNRQDPWLKRLGSRCFYALLNASTGMHLNPRAANFGAYSRRMIDAIQRMREPDRSFPFFVYWVGFNKAYLEVEHAPRLLGSSSYSFYKLMKLAVGIGMGMSDRPMRIVMGFGALLSGISFLAGVIVLWRYFAGLVSQPGYASLILSLLFASGIIVLALGFVGLYVGRIFVASKNRPLYLLANTPSDHEGN
jgi:polyisoprenyl-phosphate glycosyltransferase